MKILFLTNGPITNAGPRTRVFQYLPYFARDGIQYQVLEGSTHWPSSAANALGRVGPDSRRRKLALGAVLRGAQLANLGFAELQATRAGVEALLFDYDLIFVQGVLLTTPLVRALHARGRRVVYDIVDPVWLKGGPLQRLDRFHALVPLYDLMVLGTPATESYARAHGARDTIVLIGPIDTEAYRPRASRPASAKVRIGWVGSSSTTTYFEMVAPVLGDLCQRYPELEILTVGASKVESRGMRLEQRGWSMEREVSDLEEIDIGIMPLEDDEWCRGKGGYKLLQYMAMGLPCVASPVGVNEQIVTHGQTGLHARTPAEWHRTLAALIEDPSLRASMGAAGRVRAERELSFDVAYPRLRAALEAAVRAPARGPRGLGGLV